MVKAHPTLLRVAHPNRDSRRFRDKTVSFSLELSVNRSPVSCSLPPSLRDTDPWTLEAQSVGLMESFPPTSRPFKELTQIAPWPENRREKQNLTAKFFQHDTLSFTLLLFLKF